MLVHVLTRPTLVARRSRCSRSIKLARNYTVSLPHPDARCQNGDVTHYKKQARRRCLPSGRGLSGRLWGALGPLGTARDRSGPLGTARDRSGPLGPARDGSGRLGTARAPRDRSGPLGTTRDRSLIARPRSGARLGHLSQPASGWLGCTAGRRGGAAVRRNCKLIMRLAAKTAKSTKETAPRCAAGTPATGQTHHT